MQKPKEFEISKNVDLEIISDFLKFYKNTQDDKDNYNSIVVYMTGKKEDNDDLTGELDPVFLSYL
ncbi:MAG: hypothetical protein LIO93_02955, partial [Bacteroidales bacterium]|nr:hypothetical protein [Bacteroidales bacterium]